MYKAWILTGGCFGLALMIAFNVFNTLDGQAGLDSQQALLRAEQSLNTICHRHGFSASQLQLVAETPPLPGKSSWRFDFSAPSNSKGVSVEVDDRGQAREVSGRAL